jgi:hypothetical protein
MDAASTSTLVTALIFPAGALISVVFGRRTVAKDRGEAGECATLPIGHYWRRNDAGGSAIPTDRWGPGWLGA